MVQAGRMYDSYHEYENDPYQPAERLYVRTSVYLPDSEVDPRSGMLKPNARRHGRTQAIRMDANRLDQEYNKMDEELKTYVRDTRFTLSARMFALLVTLFVLGFGLTLIVQQGLITQRKRSLDAMNERIEDLQASNQALQAQIDEASDSAAICYAAARDLGMVPASSTQPIHLSAMETRPAGADAQAVASAQAGE